MPTEKPSFKHKELINVKKVGTVADNIPDPAHQEPGNEATCIMAVTVSNTVHNES